MSFFSLFGSNDQIMARYKGLSDEDKANLDRLIEDVGDGADDAEVLMALIQGLGSDWREHDAEAGFGKEPYAQNNTWPHVREIRNKIDEDYGTYLSKLNTSWSKLSADYGEFLNRERDEDFGSTPLEAFLMLIREGYYPPPEILLAVADCFEAYFSSSGNFEMDRFFKEPIRGQGDFAAQRHNQRDIREFSALHQSNSQLGKGHRVNEDVLAAEWLLFKRGISKPHMNGATKKEIEAWKDAVSQEIGSGRAASVLKRLYRLKKKESPPKT